MNRQASVRKERTGEVPYQSSGRIRSSMTRLILVLIVEAKLGWFPADQPMPTLCYWLCGIFVANTAYWAGFAGLSD